MTSSVSGKRSPAELIALGVENLEVETGIEPVCTALQAVASPLGHSTDVRALLRPLRADDGIRTRDPHLGKVMRYQLRHIREQRTRSSPGAKHDNSRRERAHTNFLARSCLRHRASRSRACGAFGLPADRASLPPRSPFGAVPWLSGRASASHAEGRWFDPSRDHTYRRSSDVDFVELLSACNIHASCPQQSSRQTFHNPVPRLDRHSHPGQRVPLPRPCPGQESNGHGGYAEMVCAEPALKMGKAGGHRHRRPALSGESKPGPVLAPGSPRVRRNGQGARSW